MMQIGFSCMLGPSLPGLLRADACTLIFLNGGSSHLDLAWVNRAKIFVCFRSIPYLEVRGTIGQTMRGGRQGP
jgi:hypothetical protein